jgi:4-hydroxybenzoyl-CoA reductase subunit beta
MILAPFELHRPETVDEALRLAAEFGPDFDWIAGGTDLLQNYKNRLNLKGHLIALDRLSDLQGVKPGRIGAGATLAEVSSNPDMRERFPGLCDAIEHVASPLVRNAGTIGGNLLVETRCHYFNQTIFWRGTKGSCMKAESDECLVVPQKETCYAAYSGDLAPVLMVLGASIAVASPRGNRTIPLTKFYRGDGIEKNALEKDELIVAVEIPEESAGLRHGYRKLRLRDTLDYPEMGVAAAMRLEGDRIETLRCATTAVDVVPQYVDFTDSHAGESLHDVADVVATEMQSRADPRKNTSMPVGYRKKMVRVFCHRLLVDLAEGRMVASE